jgi:hypothetical protein
MKRRWCPGLKRKYFNAGWAQLYVEEQRANGVDLEPYRCPCGWWHVRSAEKRRNKCQQKKRNKRREVWLAYQVWVDDGGPAFPEG